MKRRIMDYLKKLQENENKGFSLVELIIVMAIMAILVGVVASQVLPYMEKSRQTKDQQQLSSLATDIVSAISMSDVAVGDFPATELKDCTDATGAVNPVDAGDGSDPTAGWVTQLCQLRSSDGDNADGAIKVGSIEETIQGKLKSKKAIADKRVMVEYTAGVVTVYVADGKVEKLRVDSE